MGLSALQMSQMSRLLDEALDLNEAARARWLAQLPAEYEELVPKLRKALMQPDSSSVSASPLDTLPKFEVNSLEETLAASGLQAGKRVGPYELVRPLGAGGMAEVWLAQRADGAYKRTVALKFPLFSRLRGDLAARFVTERDILAALEHVNIARLYDAGVTPDGLPYLAMEFVAGEPLSEWCDARKLGTRERIELFLQVVDAVHYAHSRHVVHRDIKPSNILVTAQGQARLLDFGVAKLLDAESSNQAQLTQIYGRALTPDYASPEQLLGESISAQSDIYSLGVALYELLAGKRPYQLKSGSSLAVLERAIIDAEIRRPSTCVDAAAGAARATSPERLSGLLRGDLDAIVMKAMEREPRRRYETAAVLADDLRRHLTGIPVHAQPPRIDYRLRKYLSRHRTVLALGVSAALATVTMSALLQRRPPDAEPTVNEKSVAVLPFADLSENQDQGYLSEGLSADLIDHLVHARGLRIIARTSSFSFKGKSEDLRAFGARLGVAHILEGSVRRSGNTLRITAELVRVRDGTYLWSHTYDRQLQDMLSLQDEIAETVARALKVTINSDLKFRATRPRNPQAYDLKQKGDAFAAQYTTSSLEKATALYRQALQLDPDYAEAWARIASVLLTESQLAGGSSRQMLARAEDAGRRAIALNANLPSAHAALGWIFLQGFSQWDEAEAEFERASELSPTPGEDVLADYGLANLRAWRYGQVDAAIDYYRKVLAHDPLNDGFQFKLADMLYTAGRYTDALVAIRKVRDINPDFGGLHDATAMILLLEGKPTEAQAEILLEPDEELRLAGLACVAWRLQRRAEADQHLRELERRFAARAAYDIATVHAYRGEIDGAFEWLERAFRNRDASNANVLEMRIDPLLHGLRSDPRWSRLLQRQQMGSLPAQDLP